MSWKTKFAEITSLTHSEQAIWWLNGFWEEGAKDYAEEMWGIAHKFIETQIDGPILYGSKKQEIKEDSDLDEFKSHRILEILGETMTVVELRKHLAELDLDKNKRMAISEYLLDKYKKTPEALCTAPQGDVDPAELAAAQDACDKASEALDNAATEAAASAAALSASKEAAAASAKAKTEADAALAEAQAAEAVVRAAEAEVQAAVDEITKLEKVKQDKIDKAQAVIDDPNAGQVKKGRAIQEKEAILAEDELPLRKAKITQTAALKRAAKARAAAESVTEKSNAAAAAAAEAKEAADAAEAEADKAKQAADEAQVAAEASLAEAKAALDELKNKGTGSPQGKLWWMERILTEKKKFSRR